MTTQEVVDNILKDFGGVYNVIKDLAPQNSFYRSYDRGKLVNYIYVDGKRTRTNTGNLHKSVMYSVVEEGNSVISRIYVDRAAVPYYEKAVLTPTLVYARHYGRSEYGSVRYNGSKLITKKNRNYLYYMKGSIAASNAIGAWNGQTIRVTDSIEKYKG